MSSKSAIERLITDELRAQVEGVLPPRDAWDRFLASIEPSGGSESASAEAPLGNSGLDQAPNEVAVEYLDGHRWVNTGSTRRKPRLGVLAGVAATLLLAAGVLVVADANRGDQVVTGPTQSSDVAEATPSRPAADPVAAPTVFDPVSGYRWSRVAANDPGVFGDEREQGISSLTVGGPGLVAVGQADGPAVWTSVDGIAWSQPPGNEAVFDIGGGMASVTAGGPGLVAVGVAFDEDGPGEDGAAVWTSSDGLMWSRVPHDEAVFGGAAMTSVTAGGRGLVAVGWDGHPHGGESNAVVWTSPDGLSWSRVPYNDAIQGDVAGAWMWDVTAGGPGLVAVGTTTDGAAVWTSVDGINWSRVSHDETVFANSEMRSVTTGGPGLVAVGGTGNYSLPVGAKDGAAVWTSVDGSVWSRVPHDEQAFGAAGMTDVTAGGPGLVAVGFATDGAAVWTSVNGIVWSRVPHDDELFRVRNPVDMTSVVAGGPGLVAAGWSGADNPNNTADAAVWVAELEN